MKLTDKYISKINNTNPFVIYIVLYVVFIFLSLIAYNYRPLACDMSEYLNNPLRILYGEIPYVNFWLLFPPGEVYFPAIFYKLFAVNTDLVRIATIMFSCLVPVAGFNLGRLLFKDNAKSIVVAAIMYFFSVVTNYEGPDYISLYLLFIILAIIYLVKFIQTDTGRTRQIFMSGLMFAFAFLFKLYEVGGVFAAMLLFIILLSVKEKEKFRKTIKYIFAYIGPSIVFLLLLILAYGEHSGKMLNELFFESVKNGTSMNLPYFNDLFYVVNSLHNDIQNISVSVQLTVLINLFYHSMRFLVVLGYYIIPFFAILIFGAYYFVKPAKTDWYIAAIIFLWALMSFPKAFGRSDLAHLAPSVAPFLILVFYIALKSGQKLYRKTILIFVSIMFLSVTFPFIKAFSLIKSPLHYVKTEHGIVPFKNKQDMLDFDRTITYIREHTNEDDYIFVTPWDAPPIYALTKRHNPTYYDSLNDLMIRHNEAKQKKIISDLIKHDTKLIIHNADWGYDNKPEQQFRVACNLLQEFFETKCTPVAHFGFYTIYKINSLNIL